MLTGISGTRSWLDIKKKLEEVYSSISTEVHVAIDLHRKQGPDETLEEYIQNFADLLVKAMEVDPANMTNWVIICLFIRNLYNKDIRNIRRRDASTKFINTLAHALKSVHHNLLKLK